MKLKLLVVCGAKGASCVEFLDASSSFEDQRMSRNPFFELNEKHFMSCNNLANIKHNESSSKNTPIIRRTLSIRRPKSLQRLADELKPLLEAASSVSSIGSYNEVTEESIVDSSDDNRPIDINNVILRKGGKLRSLKHRPRSTVLSDRSLNSIPESLLAQNLLKRHNLNTHTLNQFSSKNKSIGLMSDVLDDIKIRDLNNTSKFQISKGDPSKSNCEKVKISDDNRMIAPDKNIVIPRRRSSGKSNNALSQAVSTTSIGEQSFSKEQKKKLKKRMRDTRKSPENSVFLGLL